MSESDDVEGLPPTIDTTVPHPARRYDYWLGGKDNFAADRASGDAIAAAFPSTRTAAIENRRFLRRAVDFLAREQGLRQFLDVGTGIPSANNTHEVAQAIAPETRVVYVDNDPIVLVHARALLTGSPVGSTSYLDADFREPEKILAHAAETLDFSQPIGLMLLAILHFIEDADDPYGTVATLLDALPSGSFLTLTHGTVDHQSPERLAAMADIIRTTPGQFRSRDEVARFVEGLEVVPPGIVSVAEWRAEDEIQPRPPAAEAEIYGVVARVP